MLLRSFVPLLLSANLALAEEYFQLQAAVGGCLGRRVQQDDLYLKECDFNDDNTMWRWDEFNRLHSKADDNDCVQAGQAPLVLNGIEALGRGTSMYVKPCNENRLDFQSFSEDWEFAGLMGDMTLESRPDLCMIHFGAEPVVGESRIMLVLCEELGSNRGMGWTAIFPENEIPEYEYFNLKAFSGGCIGRRSDGSDELFLKACTAEDETIQWRLDDKSRFRSKVDETECMQAAEYPELLQGPEGLVRGTSIYVKPCTGRLKESFQIFTTGAAVPMPVSLSGPQGQIILASRPDLCVVHFGAEPVIGESRIMLVECATLGGNRGKGWEAVPVSGGDATDVCPLDVFTCPDGTVLSRDPNLGCDFPACPDACNLDVFTCPDGTELVRDPNLDCAFPACPDTPASCPLDTFTCPDGTELSRDPNLGCEFPECPPPACPQDVFICPDESIVERDPNNDCNFFPCPVACTLDLFTCPDGTSVSRDPNNECNFFPCPNEPIVCGLDIITCPDGTELIRDPELDCEFPACPEPACPLDVFTCPDGTVLSRDPNLDCEFPACPDAPASCPQDDFTCPDGTVLNRDPSLDCNFPPCPDAPASCPQDVFTCPDGTVLNRDPSLDCNFPPCPPAACPQDIFTCPDGTVLNRDPALDCEFPACPDAPASCPLDTFTCPDGTVVSRDPDLNCGFSICPDTPAACPSDTFTCPDGTVLSRDPDLGCEFPSCPAPPAGLCPLDTFTCPDGTVLTRDPELNCLFPPCPQVPLP